eukprot:4914068-Amphidinium_carterae.2
MLNFPIDPNNQGRVRSVEGPEYDELYKPRSGYIGAPTGRIPYPAQPKAFAAPVLGFDAPAPVPGQPLYNPNRNVEPNAVCGPYGWHKFQAPNKQYPLEMYLRPLEQQRAAEEAARNPGMFGSLFGTSTATSPPPPSAASH